MQHSNLLNGLSYENRLHTFPSMDADCLNTFQQQILMNVINLCFLLRENQNLRINHKYVIVNKIQTMVHTINLN